MTDNIGLYIHIPFCKSKCKYCDFYSFKSDDYGYDEYVNEVVNKIKFWSYKTDKSVSSIYFGGGTPSILGTDRLCRILKEIYNNFNVVNGAEITLEVNPESGKKIDFVKLNSTGFNRLSIGLQSSDESELKMLGRIHNANDAVVTVEKAQAEGFTNISLDLMMAIPNQTKESLLKSIAFCASLGVTHISSYILKIEEGTEFYKLKDSLNLMDDDNAAELYISAVKQLNSLGYSQYEISNFAKKGFEGRHNINYWKCGEYIGIGPSAHSFLNGRRFYYNRNMKNFKNNKITDDGMGGDYEEYIMLALRLNEGLSFKEFEKRFRAPLPDSFIKKIINYSKNGFMIYSKDKVCFTTRGFLVSNTIISDLLS